MRDRQREGGRDRRVDRVAAGADHLETDLGADLILSDHHALAGARGGGGSGQQGSRDQGSRR